MFDINKIGEKNIAAKIRKSIKSGDLKKEKNFQTKNEIIYLTDDIFSSITKHLVYEVNTPKGIERLI